MWSNPTAKPRRPTPKQVAGQRGERLAANYLQEQGLKPLRHNVLYRQGEIDLIMQDGEQLVFVEVRYRQDDAYGGPLASVTISKQRKLIKAAQRYLQQVYGDRPPSCRFDVVGICERQGLPHIEWIRNAFY